MLVSKLLTEARSPRHTTPMYEPGFSVVSWHTAHQHKFNYMPQLASQNRWQSVIRSSNYNQIVQLLLVKAPKNATNKKNEERNTYRPIG